MNEVKKLSEVTMEELQKRFDFYKKQLPSGFTNLDKTAPILPGLYVLGALPATGKTTFMLNVAANICKSGTPVLYVSYEQEYEEMLATLIANYWFKEQCEGIDGETQKRFYKVNANALENSPSAQEILMQFETCEDNKKREEMKDWFKFFFGEWQRNHPNFYFLRGVAESATELQKVIEKYVDKYGVKFVVIDYLQMIPAEPKDFKKSIREITDSAVKMLNNVAKEKGISIFAVSSLNRENYSKEGNLTAYKESGGIEYTARTGFILQAKLEPDETRNADTLKQAKKKTPRIIELACVKGRYNSEDSVYFEYYSKYATFFECESEEEPKRKRKRV